MARNRRHSLESVRFDVAVLSRRVAILGLLRGEFGEKAGLSSQPIADAFAGRPVGVRAARAIAGALGCKLSEIVAAEPAETAATSAA